MKGKLKVEGFYGRKLTKQLFWIGYQILKDLKQLERPSLYIGSTDEGHIS